MNNKKCYGPFQLWVLNNFPFTIDDWDSVTQYQMLLKCLGALKEQLDINSDLYKKISDLENLDLQDEVNNKIDEMAESGQLQEIITEYLQINGVLAFNTVSDMVSATNIINGSVCKTLGFNSYNDGKGEFYKIRTITSEDTVDGINIIALNISNTLIAEKINNVNYDSIDVRLFGCVGDGVTDNHDILQSLFNTYDNLVFNDGVYYSSQTLNLKSNTIISGNGTLKSNINIEGTSGDNITFTDLSENKITSSETLEQNQLVYVYYYDENNINNSKRQVTEIANSDGYLKNNLLNYGNSYTIKKIISKENITIKDLTIDGNIYINKSKNIVIDNVKMITTSNNAITDCILVNKCYNVTIKNSILEFGNECLIDFNSGSSNCEVINCKFNGGNTESDNGSLKMNEVFYSLVDGCYFGSKRYGVSGRLGYYHAIMIDGEWTEDGYNWNHSQFININNCYVSKNYDTSYYVSIAKNINFNNCVGNNLTVKYSDNVTFNNGSINSLNNESSNTNLKFINSKVGLISDGSMSNMSFIKCILDELITKASTDNIEIVDCSLNKLKSSYNVPNSVNNLIMKNTVINQQCQLFGIKNSSIDIVLKCQAHISNVTNNNIKMLFIDNVNNDNSNIWIQNTVEHNFIEFHITDNALANTALYNELGYSGMATNTFNGNLTSTNNYDANPLLSFTKSNSYPTDSSQHQKGEIIFNINPQANGVIGWVCVSGGTPGTWKSFGNIAS